MQGCIMKSEIKAIILLFHERMEQCLLKIPPEAITSGSYLDWNSSGRTYGSLGIGWCCTGNAPAEPSQSSGFSPLNENRLTASYLLVLRVSAREFPI